MQESRLQQSIKPATHCLLLQEIQIAFGFIFLVLGSPGQNPESRKMVVVEVSLDTWCLRYVSRQRQTYRHAECNTSHHSRGQSNNYYYNHRDKGLQQHLTTNNKYTVQQVIWHDVSRSQWQEYVLKGCHLDIRAEIKKS